MRRIYNMVDSARRGCASEVAQLELAEDDQNNPVVGISATAVWTVVVKRVGALRIEEGGKKTFANVSGLNNSCRLAGNLESLVSHISPSCSLYLSTVLSWILFWTLAEYVRALMYWNENFDRARVFWVCKSDNCQTNPAAAKCGEVHQVQVSAQYNLIMFSILDLYFKKLRALNTQHLIIKKKFRCPLPSLTSPKPLSTLPEPKPD